jgi:hypothetical protein
MGTPFQLREVHYSAESAFAENVTTFATRIPVESADLSGLTHVRAPYQGGKSRMNAGEPDHVMTRGGSFSITTNLIGHHGTAAGALTPTWLYDLLSLGLGGGDVASVGTTINNTSTVTSLAVASVSGKALGQGLRVGTKGDGRGDGQFTIVNSPAGPITTLTALPGIPTNGDVVYASQAVFHSESACLTGLTSRRFAVSWVGSTGVEQIYIRGCQLSGLSITCPFNDVPKVTMTFVCAYWDYGASLTIPSALTLQNNYSQPVAAGSLFLQDYGTTTRAVYTPSEVELTYDIGTEPIVGPGAVFPLQSAVGFVRTRMKPTLRMRLPVASTWPTWWDSVESASSHFKHVLFTGSAVDGRALGIYMPRVKPCGQRPAIPVESNGQTYVDVFGMGVDDETRSTEIARSAVRIFMG